MSEVVAYTQIKVGELPVTILFIIPGPVNRPGS